MRHAVDMLNQKSYDFHYKSLDSARICAQKAFHLSAEYSDGKAEALNNMAFVDIARMEYEKADSMLLSIGSVTRNQVELLVADVQMMRLCQRMSANRRFYDVRENAVNRLKRVKEDIEELTPRQKSRLMYAESEMAIVTSTYYYYVGQNRMSSKALLSFNPETIKADTAQYLNYLYNVGSGGILDGKSQQDLCQREFEYLIGCYVLAKKAGIIYFQANALESIAGHLLDSIDRRTIIDNNPAAMRVIDMTDCPEEDIAGTLAIEALSQFETYGDTYQIAGAYRTLASCYMRAGDYESAINYLNAAIADTIIDKAPDLVASIREQMSVAYSAIDDKPSSDYNRNIYLDMQDETRQDRLLESRADMLRKTSRQLNILLMVVGMAIVLLLVSLWLFNRLYRKQNSDDATRKLLAPLEEWRKTNEEDTRRLADEYEEIEEKKALCRLNKEEYVKRNLEQRARMSMVVSMLPFIDRIINEVNMLRHRDESKEVRDYREQYIAELIDQINDNNALLTQWIKLSEGQLSIKVNSFSVEDLFAILRKNENTFSSRGITLSVKTTSAMVKADRVLTLFMINTLADNAMKHTPKGGSVEIYADTTERYVEISVKDSGCGLTDEEKATIFDRKINEGHGFGLMNCRGIIEKYKKTSPVFSIASLGVESTRGKGSRFFFRLPLGMARRVMALAMLMTMTCSAVAGESKQDYMKKAASYADSAYYSNIAGTYSRTVDFADSCRQYLNRQYSRLVPGGKMLLQKYGKTELAIPEVRWLHDKLDIDYNVILDMRNECAVAALALHDWELYAYNNKVFTVLYNQLSADNTLAEYCAQMRSSQTNKTISVIILVLLLLAILPAYYMLYYRHRLYFRYCEERIAQINTIVNSTVPLEEKKSAIDRLALYDFPVQLQPVVDTIRQTIDRAIDTRQRSQEDIDNATDQLHKAEYESNNLYVSNSILDNCLSALKHETMYYPGRIRQMMNTGQVGDVAEVVEYYRNVYAMLCSQAADQVGKIKIGVRRVAIDQLLSSYDHNADAGYVLANALLVEILLDTLCRQTADRHISVNTDNDVVGYVRFSVSMPKFKDVGIAVERLFVPVSEQSVPFLLCRQVIRDHSEATNCRGCGIYAQQAPEGITVIFTLPAR